jgi:hypothetical protein
MTVPPLIDLSDRTFGRLTVSCRGPNDKHGKPQWWCACDCGATVLRLGASLVNNRTGSCGCLHREIVADVCRETGKKSRTHGMTRTPEWRAWVNMITRCTNKNCPEYHNYGGRGICVCSEWLESFEEFYAHVGPRPSDKHSIDRIEVDGNYEPGNLRWATIDVQNSNKRNSKRTPCLDKSLTASQ